MPRSAPPGTPATAIALAERAVAITDAFLALECAAFAIAIARDHRGRRSPLRMPFVGFFGATAVASGAGAILHGLTSDRSDPRRRLLWRGSLGAIGVAAFASWLLALRLVIRGPIRGRLERLVAAAHAPYFGLVVATDQPYRTAVAWYVPGAATLGLALATRLRDPDDRPPVAAALAGLGVTFAAAVVQTRRIGVGARFDHNALYHSLQAGGVALFHLAARGFLGRRSA